MITFISSLPPPSTLAHNDNPERTEDANRTNYETYQKHPQHHLYDQV
jgi:hypothetical protein